MIDTVPTQTTSGTTANSPLDVLAQSAVASQDRSGQDRTAAASRTITDRVDLSQTAKLAAEYKANAGADGKKPAEQLAESLKQAKRVTDSFAAQLKAGRTANTFSSTDFNTAVRDAVTSIMREGKPSDLISRVVKSLLGG